MEALGRRIGFMLPVGIMENHMDIEHEMATGLVPWFAGSVGSHRGISLRSYSRILKVYSVIKVYWSCLSLALKQ